MCPSVLAENTVFGIYWNKFLSAECTVFIYWIPFEVMCNIQHTQACKIQHCAFWSIFALELTQINWDYNWQFMLTGSPCKLQVDMRRGGKHTHSLVFH